MPRGGSQLREYDGSMPLPPSGGGMHTLKPDDALRAHVDSLLTQRLQSMWLKSVNAIEAEPYCVLCEGSVHDTNLCTCIPIIKETMRNPGAEVNWLGNQGFNNFNSNKGGQNQSYRQQQPQPQSDYLSLSSSTVIRTTNKRKRH